MEKTLLNFTIKENKKLIYAIINTSEYCGPMGVIISECDKPEDLETYGFYEEIEAISKMEVGDKVDSEYYGKEAIVIRIQ